MHIKLPNLSKNLDEFHKIAGKYNLQVRGSAGEHSEAVGGIYDISNKVSLIYAVIGINLVGIFSGPQI